MKRALQVVLGIALFGALFSGTLTYRELFGGAQAAATCTIPVAEGTILGYPACVYGLVMYLAITAVAAAGLLSERRRPYRPGSGAPSGAPARP